MPSFKNSNRVPLYPIGIAAELVGISPATLRIWEKRGLIDPARRGKNRYYSQDDLQRLQKIRHLLGEKGLNLAGARTVLGSPPCWEIKNCGARKSACPVYRAGHSKLQEQADDPARR